MKRLKASLRRTTSLILLVGLAATAQPAGLEAQTTDISGVWEISTVLFGETWRVERFTFQLNGEGVTGFATDGSGRKLSLEGNAVGQKIEFGLRLPDSTYPVTYVGTIHNGTMSGTVSILGQQYTWTARRAATRPSDAPRLHHFVPQEFHRVFSGAIPPALRIFPGDTVRTQTVDSGGRDEHSAKRSLGGNPVTGPFYIEGALPGDTLVVHFNQVRLNRNSARGGRGFIRNALTPDYLLGANPVTDFDSNWRLDAERGVAVLAKPTPRLKNFAVPLQPMVGCVGVAPPRVQAISTSDSGNHGGNMDYNQIGEGATVYLPVFQQGALLFVGDGHAIQGDGELTGAALETSLKLEFTVDVLPGKSIATPRAENDDFLMAIGIGGSLTQAVQRATSELARWLQSDYNLNVAEVAMVLGTSMRYDVAELVGRQVSIVAKIGKPLLAQLNEE
jgi:amidase